MFKTLDRNLMQLSGANISHRHRIRNGSGKLCREGLCGAEMLAGDGVYSSWAKKKDQDQRLIFHSHLFSYLSFLSCESNLVQQGAS